MRRVVMLSSLLTALFVLFNLREASRGFAADALAGKQPVPTDSNQKKLDRETNRNRNIHFRGSLNNSRIQFQRKKTGHVVFMGGSITEMNGYRPMVMKALQEIFPKTKFTFTDAGIASTCSTTGAFRLKTDVLEKGPVDLFFVEFAVNDDQDAGYGRRECLRGMEGIIRHIRSHNPHADIVMTHFVNPGMLKILQAGKTPLSSGTHETVARHYDVSTINLQKEVAERISAGTLTWEKYGGTHPKPFGNAIAAEMIRTLLLNAWEMPLSPNTRKVAHPTPRKPLDEKHYGAGRFINPQEAQIDDRWQLRVPDWKNLRGQCRSRFIKTLLLCATTPAAQLRLEFTGTAVGAYILAGPDAGIVEVHIDQEPAKTIDLFHRFSKGLHYPRTVMFGTDLKPGKHQLTLRVTSKKNPNSIGTAIRILQFTAN